MGRGSETKDGYMVSGTKKLRTKEYSRWSCMLTRVGVSKYMVERLHTITISETSIEMRAGL
jgi:hypothetical protein